MAPLPGSVTLATCVPEVGRLIPSRTSICRRVDRDSEILEAIRHHLTRRLFDKRKVTPLISATLATATAEVLTYQPEDNQDEDIALYQAIAQAQDKTAWATELPASVFAELLTELRASRQGYLEADDGSSEAPTPMSQAGKLLTAIDDFQTAIETRGWGYNEELMALAGHDEGVEVGVESESESDGDGEGEGEDDEDEEVEEEREEVEEEEEVVEDDDNSEEDEEDKADVEDDESEEDEEDGEDEG